MPRNTNTNGQYPQFDGFGSPNYTQVPDELFDVLMPQLSHVELRVLLYVIRRTFGFKRESDNISLKQMVDGITTNDGRRLDQGAGLSKSSAATAVKGLVEKGIVVVHRNRSTARGDEPTTYALRFRDTPVSKNWTGEGSPEIGHPRVQNLDTQYTGIQKTERISNTRKAHAKTSDRTDGTGKPPEPTLLDASVPAHSVSHPLVDRPAPPVSRQDPVTSPVEAAAAPEPSQPSNDSPPARTRGLGDSVPSDAGVQEPFETTGPGFENLRRRVEQIRAENKRRQEAEQQETERVTQAVPLRTSSGMTPLAAVLPAKRGRPPGSMDERERVTAYLRDYALEFRDQATLKQSVSRAVNIFKAADVAPERWDDYLNQAKQITREKTHQIQKVIDDPSRVIAAKNKMPYFFGVLEDLCGLREQSGSPQPSTA